MRKPTPYGMTLNLIIIARFISEVVIQIAIELICKGAIFPQEILHHKFSYIKSIHQGFVIDF